MPNVTTVPAGNPRSVLLPELPEQPEQPKAIETPDQRATRERSATEAEVRAIREAYEALYRLSPAGPRRAFTWLHDRLESHGRDGTDPWEE